MFMHVCVHVACTWLCLVYLQHPCFICGVGEVTRKQRRQRRKHWIFIRFHYKGCKGTKTKASTPEDRQGPAKCTLSRLAPPTAGAHTHGLWDIHSRVYMLRGQSQPGDRGTQAGQGSD